MMKWSIEILHKKICTNWTDEEHNSERTLLEFDEAPSKKVSIEHCGVAGFTWRLKQKKIICLKSEHIKRHLIIPKANKFQVAVENNG